MSAASEPLEEFLLPPIKSELYFGTSKFFTIGAYLYPQCTYTKKSVLLSMSSAVKSMSACIVTEQKQQLTFKLIAFAPAEI